MSKLISKSRDIQLQGVLIKLNPGLPWQKLHLTRRRICLPANWT
jgi:hypothetical protein